MTETLNTTPWVWRLLVGFIAIATLSVPVSTDIRISSAKLAVATINWFLVFFVSAYTFRTPGRVLKLGYMLWIVALIVSFIAVQEWRHSVLPWAGHIPSFLAVQDESVQRILAGSARAATGIYRVQSKFSTPLGLAEFYALIIPFLLHFTMKGSSIYIRVMAAASIPFFFWVVRLTDSRLGVVGFLVGGTLYVAVWGFWRWRRLPDGLLGLSILMMYPMIFSGLVAATLFVGRLRNMVWGTGAQQASNDSRQTQVLVGIPKAIVRPWGYGIGRSGETLGFTNGAGVMTVDSYYLTVLLEYGFLGFLIYYGMFINGIWHGIKRIGKSANGEEDMIAPVTIAIINFVVIKSIFSQQDNHSLVFALLGAIVALCWRIDQRALANGRIVT